MKSFFFVFLILTLSSVLLFWKYAPRELPLDRKIRFSSGESEEVTILGKTERHLTVRNRETKERREIELSELSLFERPLSWFLPDQEAPSIAYPLHRTITNQAGKSFDGIVTGNSNGYISVQHKENKSGYVIDIAGLSQADQEFFGNLPALESLEIDQFLKNRRLAGRHAIWHRQLHNAIHEAGKTQLPILLLFKSSAGEESTEIDTNVFMSSQFREWANMNVVLCMYYNNPDREKGTATLNGLSSAEGREMARKFKVGTRTPVAVILDSTGRKTGQVSGYNRENASNYITRLEKALP
ncbi:MAG: hypothetical protein P1U86_21965 [Verrucomicrobiales bacterium]|nr:hypothetical protein [Verrucomicrobiales bacterium]